MTNKLLLRKRSIIEIINDQLKNISQIEHSRHRRPINFLVNLVSGLIAYTHQPITIFTGRTHTSCIWISLVV